MLRWFESNPAQLNNLRNYNFLIVKCYTPVIFLITKYKNKPNRKQVSSKKIRNFGTLNKFLRGAKITKINPAKLLIKNRGYLEILFQKSLIEYN